MDRFTVDQRAAVEARGENLLISAAAGSGKTTVLVERLCSLIDEGVHIDEMLIITFTRAAAADMRRKISERLSERAQQSAHHMEQLDRMERANLSTIHSFLLDVLKNGFEAAGIDPGFRLLDSAEQETLIEEAMGTAMSAVYARGGSALDALCFGRDADRVRELARALYDFALNRPSPEAFLDRWTHQEDVSVWAEELVRSAGRAIGDARVVALAALQESDAANLPYSKTLAEDLRALDELLGQRDYEALRLSLEGFSFIRLASYRGEKTEAVDRVKAMRDQLKKQINDEKKRFKPLASLEQDHRASLPALQALREIVRETHANLEALKAERSAYGFSDLEHRALRALHREDVAEGYRQRFRYVFVDEYQDVSDIQEAIIRQVSREDNLFMVGDVKQSIYRFRQAEPSLFLDKYRRYQLHDGGRLIALKQNFRSRPGLLRFVNRVFESVMVGGDTEIDYDEAARLNPGASFEGDDPPVEMHLIYTKGAEAAEQPASVSDEDEESEPPEKIEREAMVVCERILALLREDIYDPRLKAYRRMRPRDIAVFARNNQDLRRTEEVLRAAGIDAYLDAQESFFDVFEVRLMLSLLRLIENHRRDLEWLAVLRSPMVGLNSVELMRIRALSPEGAYADAVMTYMATDDALAARLRDFYGQLERFRELSAALPVWQLIDEIDRATQYSAFMAGLPGGAQRMANYEALIRHAGQFERLRSGGLTAFLRYMEQVRAAKRQSDDFSAAHTLAEGDDAVRLMTIHKSKGLEFPVVIALNMGKSFARKKSETGISLHRDLGIGMPYHDPALFSARDTISLMAIKERIRQEDLNEEMRVLYVLLTRAQDRLILTGTVSDIEKQSVQWDVLRTVRARPKSYLDALVPAMIGNDEAHIRALYAGDVGLRAPGDQAAPAAAALEAEAAESAEHPLMWTYPYRDRVLLPLKLTATGIARTVAGPAAMEALMEEPRFLSGEDMSSAERGSLTHAAMQALDLHALKPLRGPALGAAIDEQLRRLNARGVLFAPVNARWITRFFEEDLGARLLKSERVEREWAFNLRLSAQDAGLEGGEQEILVQGVVDCCFIEGDGWILMDYKTDKSDDVAALKAQYAPQIRLYRRAIEDITGRPVRETYIVLLRLGVEIPVESEGEEINDQ